MRRILIIALLLPLFSFAQKCDFIENKTDDFTGKKILNTTLYLSGGTLAGGGEMFIISKTDTLFNIAYTNISLYLPSYPLDTDFNKTVMYLKFEDGETMRLKSLQEYYTETKKELPENKMLIAFGGFPTKAQLEKIGQKPLLKIRCAFNDNMETSFDVDIKKNKRSKISENANCILTGG